MTIPTTRQFLGIFVEKCPCYNEALPDCPLSAMRSITDACERQKKLDAMSDDEIQDLFRQHVLCVNRACGS